MKLELIHGLPDEILVLDEPEPCPYLPGRMARMPLRLPVRPLTLEETDVRLEQGDRRHGRLLYAPACPTCSACEAIRIDVRRFVPSRTQARVKRRGDARLAVELGPPELSRDRLALYEKHKRGRDLVSGTGKPLDEKGYFGFLVDRCVEAFEIGYWLDGSLVGVAITDRGATTLSAVYTFFDPDHPALSIGTYSILTQLALAEAWGMTHLYLGLYIGENEHMRYKARFLPHERRIDGKWRVFDRPDK
jgi:arginine-tRNA-protein transferase